MAKASVMVAWSFALYSYLQLTVHQVSDCWPLGLLVLFCYMWSLDSLSLTQSFVLQEHVIEQAVEYSRNLAKIFLNVLAPTG